MSKTFIMTVAGAALVAASTVAPSYAGDKYVKGHWRKDGTYVRPHYRSKANKSRYDNFSTKGNLNPYTGKTGSKQPKNDWHYGTTKSKSNW